VISSPQVVDRVILSFRKIGSTNYFELNLKLDSELLYEGSIPYFARIEYYLTVLPERGPASAVGSKFDPRLLVSDDLPKSEEMKRKKIKYAVWVCIAAVAAALFTSGDFSVYAPHKRRSSSSRQ